MVEYTVDTLVNLYDSLNAQIAEVIDNLNEFSKVSIDPHLADQCRADIEKEYKKATDRLNRLTDMRNDTEVLLQKILKVERVEAE